MSARTGSWFLEADARTGEVSRVARLAVAPVYPAVGAGSLWSGSAAVWENPTSQDDRLVRIDPATLRIVETLDLGGNVTAVDFWFGSVWAALATRQVVRIAPAGRLS